MLNKENLTLQGGKCTGIYWLTLTEKIWELFPLSLTIGTSRSVFQDLFRFALEKRFIYTLFVQPLKCGAFSGRFVRDLCTYRRTCFQALRK